MQNSSRCASQVPILGTHWIQHPSLRPRGPAHSAQQCKARCRPGKFPWLVPASPFLLGTRSRTASPPLSAWHCRVECTSTSSTCRHMNFHFQEVGQFWLAQGLNFHRNVHSLCRDSNGQPSGGQDNDNPEGQTDGILSTPLRVLQDQTRTRPANIPATSISAKMSKESHIERTAHEPRDRVRDPTR